MLRCNKATASPSMDITVPGAPGIHVRAGEHHGGPTGVKQVFSVLEQASVSAPFIPSPYGFEQSSHISTFLSVKSDNCNFSYFSKNMTISS